MPPYILKTLNYTVVNVIHILMRLMSEMKIHVDGKTIKSKTKLAGIKEIMVSLDR